MNLKDWSALNFKKSLLLSLIPGLVKAMHVMANAPRDLLRDPVLVIIAAVMHWTIFVIDAGTLWVILQVVGKIVSFWSIFPAFIIASMVAIVGPVPLGLGSFGMTCVSMLVVMGVEVDPAFKATILLRGLPSGCPCCKAFCLHKGLYANLLLEFHEKIDIQ